MSFGWCFEIQPSRDPLTITVSISAGISTITLRDHDRIRQFAGALNRMIDYIDKEKEKRANGNQAILPTTSGARDSVHEATDP